MRVCATKRNMLHDAGLGVEELGLLVTAEWRRVHSDPARRGLVEAIA